MSHFLGDNKTHFVQLFLLLCRLSSDFEIQTQVQQGSASTQTSYDEDSQWYKYTKTVEEYRKTSEKVTNRQLSDGETQTDIPSDDNLRVMTTTHEGK